MSPRSFQLDSTQFSNHDEAVESSEIVGWSTVGARNFHMIHYKLAPGAVLGAHWHDFEQAHFVFGGSGTTIVDGHEYVVKRNTVLWLPMGSVHETNNTGKEPLEYIDISSPPASMFQEPDHSPDSKPKWITERSSANMFGLDDINQGKLEQSMKERIDSKGGININVLLGSTVGARNFHMIHYKLAPGAVLGAHWHDFEQAHFVFGGSGTTIVDGHEYVVKRNTVLWLPMGSVHETNNTGKEPLEYIDISSPPASMFQEPDHSLSSSKVILREAA